MPIYLYAHPKTGEIKEVIQTISEEHKYVDSEGVEWIREFTVPNAGVDTKWDANDSKDFVEKSRKKKGTIGDLEDKAKELSLKREQKLGYDPVKEKMYSDYTKSRNGAMHPKQRKEKFEEKKKKFSKLGFDVSI